MLPIGERIRNLRRMKNETQDELASVLGVSFQAVSRWENADAYPDIELLPKLAAHFDVTTDELLGTDDETRKKEREKLEADYRSRVREGWGTRGHFERMRQAFAEFPEQVDFAYYALLDVVDHRCVPREEGLPFARELGEKLVGTQYQQEAVRMMTLYEDEPTRWFDLALDAYTLPRLREKRYAYRGENDLCSRQRQINLFTDLNYLIWNDLGKKTKDGREDLPSWNEGLAAALRIIDCLRDPARDEDGWIDERLWIYLLLSSNDYILGKKDEGDKALEKALGLIEIIAKYPPDHVFPFGVPSLDLLEPSLKNGFSSITESDEIDHRTNYLNILKNLVCTKQGWFGPMLGEPRVQAVSARLCELTPPLQKNYLFMNHILAVRLDAIGWDRDF